MSQFSGPYPGYKNPGTGTKGIMRARREQKRLEAEVRDELLPADDPKRRSVRLGSLPAPETKTRRRHRNRKTTQIQPEIPGCDCGALMITGGMSSAHLDWCALVINNLL